MRRSNLHPQLSAYAHMYGNFNYDATPMAPAGTKAIIYNSADTRGSWDQRGEDGWYVGPAQEHYRCYRAINKKTRSAVTTDTIELYPTYVNIPTLTPAESLMIAATDLTKAIIQAKPKQLQIDNQQLQQLQQLAKILEHAANKNKKDNTLQRVETPQTITPQRVPQITINKQKSNIHYPTNYPTLNPNPMPTLGPSPMPTLGPTNPKPILRNTTTIINKVPDPHIRPPTHRYPTRLSQSAHAVFDAETGKLLEYNQLIKHLKYKKVWSKSMANEFGRLA